MGSSVLRPGPHALPDGIELLAFAKHRLLDLRSDDRTNFSEIRAYRLDLLAATMRNSRSPSRLPAATSHQAVCGDSRTDWCQIRTSCFLSMSIDATIPVVQERWDSKESRRGSCSGSGFVGRFPPRPHRWRAVCELANSRVGLECSFHRFTFVLFHSS